MIIRYNPQRALASPLAFAALATLAALVIWPHEPALSQTRTEKAGTIVRDLNGPHGPETFEWVNGKGHTLRRKEAGIKARGFTANPQEPLTLKVQNVNTLKYSVAASTQQAELFVQADGFLKVISGIAGGGNGFTAQAPAPDLADKKLGKAGRALAAAKPSDLALSLQSFSPQTALYIGAVDRLLRMRQVDSAIIASVPDSQGIDPSAVYAAATRAVSNNLGRPPAMGSSFAAGDIVKEGASRFDDVRARYDGVLAEKKEALENLQKKRDDAVASAKTDKRKADDDARQERSNADKVVRGAYEEAVKNAEKNRDIRIKRAELLRGKPAQHQQAIKDLIELYRKDIAAAETIRSNALDLNEAKLNKALDASSADLKTRVDAADKSLADGKSKAEKDYAAFDDFHKSLLTEHSGKLAPLFNNADANYQTILGNTFEVYFIPTTVRGDNLKFFLDIVPLDSAAATAAQDTVSKEPIAEVQSIDTVKVEFSTGLMLHNLVTTNFSTSGRDERGQTLPPSTVVDSSGVVSTVPSVRIVRDPQDTLQVAFSAFAHIYPRRACFLKPGISFGVGLREALSSPIISIGPSLILGERQRGIITYGVAFGRVKRLNGFSVGQVLPQNTSGLTTPLPTTDKFVFGHFLSITFNL
jgi:hypothetical protein